MNQWKIWLAAAVLLLARTQPAGTDIDDLAPVEVLQVLSDSEGVWILTDSGAAGRGASLPIALENLHSAAPKRIFLETVQYLLVDREVWVKELSAVLRPACRVCLASEQVDLELVPEYLSTHDMKVTMLQYLTATAELPRLYSKEGRSQLVR